MRTSPPFSPHPFLAGLGAALILAGSSINGWTAASTWSGGGADNNWSTAVSTYGGTLALGGTWTGTNTIAGVIPDASSANLVSVTVNSLGTWVLSGTNTYSGTTAVNGGTLAVNGWLGTNSVTVTNAALIGAGTIQGPVAVQLNGTLQAGSNRSALGTMTVSNTLTLAGKTVVLLNRTNAQTASLVKGISTLAYGGMLAITTQTE